MTPSPDSPDREPARTPARHAARRPAPAWRATRRPLAAGRPPRETTPARPLSFAGPREAPPARPLPTAGYAPRDTEPAGHPAEETSAAEPLPLSPEEPPAAPPPPEEPPAGLPLEEPAGHPYRETPPAPKPAARRPVIPQPADPVSTLIRHHHRLCAHAVDPLEIAAGLEAHGLTDRTAARFRHRDVFSLAEELYARVPRARTATVPPPEPAPRETAVRGVLQTLPGAVCAATLAALAALHPGPARPGAAVAGAVLVLLALRLSLRAGPLRARRTGRPPALAVLAVAWIVGHALLGAAPLTALLPGGPGPRPPWPHPDAATALALTCAVAPAAVLARWFARRARRGLAVSRELAELASRIRPALLGATLLFAAVQLALLLGARHLTGGPADPPAALVATTALGTLLLLARLLAVHGFRTAAVAGPALAAALEALALALPLLARLPGAAALDRPVAALTAAAGPAAVPAVACTAAALALLGHALRTLTGARAHPAPADAEVARP
ncbi:hypothetical protein [Streptomyces catenulae]|uniref:Integral membrane protein n=1 Tax=Streptomyces catenulae TaxID=66875 RepID=A0ABV2YT22_9ACTN|nr:hypothetical protein [Streptomyces catenulae]